MRFWIFSTLAIQLAWPSRPAFSIYYGDPKPYWKELCRVPYVILEPDFPEMVLPDSCSTQWIAYLSLGEVHQSRPYFKEFQSELLPENPNWPAAFRIDPRSEKWRHYLLEVLIPDLKAKGWGGLFFDTVDNGPWLEMQDSSRFAGSKEAMADLIRSIRKAWPNGFFVLNNGYELQPEISPYVDRILLEGLNSRWDFSKKTYGPSPAGERQMRIDRARQSLALHPQTQFWVLDYAQNAKDPLSAWAKKAHKKQNFQGIVSELSLQTRTPF